MRKIGILGLLAASVALSGCDEASMAAMAPAASAGGATQTSAQAGPSTQKTAAEVKLEADARSLNQITTNIVVRNTVEGAVVGAIAGCAIMMMMGGDGNDCARGAVAGGVVGGVAGNQVGQAAAQKNAELVNRDQILTNLRGVSTRLNTVEADLRAVVSSQNAEIVSLNRQVTAGQISNSAYTARINTINSNRRTVGASLLSTENNVIRARNQIGDATRQGQQGLSGVDSAAASTQARLERNRKLLAIVG